MKKSRIVRIPVPKIRRPVARKPNTTMKSKKDFTRKKKHKEVYE